MKRGFKAQSERRSIELRKRLGLTETDRLSAIDLANLFSTFVISADEVPDLSEESRQQLFHNDRESWSAFTLKKDNHNMIIYQPSQRPYRINSVLMHELSHIILGHTFSDVSTSTEGHMMIDNYDKDQEDEADWLSGALLLPRPALVWMQKQQLSQANACERFFVSLDMLNWRTRMTGVKKQMSYSKR